MLTQQTGFVLRFDDSSQFPGMLVALDEPSGGYPTAVETPLRAQIWTSEEDALRYAKMFQPRDNSYHAYAIEQRVHYLTAEVDDVKR